MQLICADIENLIHRDAIVKLMNEYFLYGNELSMKAAGISFGISTDEELIESLEKFKPSAGGAFFLVETEHRFVGIGAYRDLGNGRAEMKRVFIQPAFRGKSWGKSLVTHLIDYARSAGFDTMMMESGTYMPEARNLYRSLGFQEIEPYCGSECGDQNLEVLYYMELKLVAHQR